MVGGTPTGDAGRLPFLNRTNRPGLKWPGMTPLLAILLLLVLRALPVLPSFEAPFLTEILTTIFLGAVNLAVACLAARAYARAPLPQILWIGSASLVLSLVSLSVWRYPVALNTTITIANGGYLLASVLYVAGAAVWIAGINPPPESGARKAAIVVAYSMSVSLLVVLVILALRGVLPPFHIEGTGFTTARLFAHASAASLFLLAGLLLLWQYFKSGNRFIYWYSLGMLLMGTGMATRMFAAGPNDLMSWLGRLDTYLGGIFVAIAVATAVREARGRHAPVASIIAGFFRQARTNYQRAGLSAGAAASSEAGATFNDGELWSGAKWAGQAAALLMVLLLFLFFVADVGLVLYTPTIFVVLNILFVVLISLVVAFLAARSFVTTGRPELAWLGGGALAFGLSNMLSSLVQVQGQLNAAVAAHNTGALLSGLLYAAGALVGLRGGSPAPRAAAVHVLISIYGAVAMVVPLVVSFSLSGILPAFFIPGIGGTALRQAVLTSANALFAISGTVFLVAWIRSRASFLYWYGMGLVLIALGLFTVGLIETPGDIFAWLGRAAQYVGGVYLTIAVATLVGEARARHASLDEVMAEFGKQAELNYKLLVDSASDAIMAVDGLGRIFAFNPAAEKMFGYRRSEAIGTPFFDLIGSPGDVDAYQKVTDTTASPERDSPDPVTLELRARRRNGEDFPVEMTLVSRRLTAGRLPAATTLVVRDITERKKAEELVRFQSMLVDSAQDAIIAATLTPRGEFITRTWNRGAEALYGWLAEEVIGKPALDFLQPEFASPAPFEEQWRRFLEQGYWAGEIEGRRKDGTRVSVLTSNTPLRDDKDNIIGVVGVHRDITERKKAERDLKEGEERFLKAFHSSPAALTIARLPEGRWVDANGAFLDLVGYSREEVIGRTSAELNMFPDPNERAELLRVFLDKGSVQDRELTVRTKTGKLRTVLSSNVKVSLNGQEHAISTILDITERKKAAQLKDEFIGMVSHELRTPLTVIMGALRTATMKELSREQIQELIQDAISSSDTLAGIVENLLELSRSQAQRLALDTRLVDIGQIAGEIVKKLQRITPLHQLKVDLAEGLPAVVIDRVRVERVLYNLVENAIKYSPGGGEVTVSARWQGNDLVICVSDQGPGISPEDQPKLFQSFEQLEMSNRRATQGVGLGLKVCRTLVEAHGGRIWVESQPGKGSSFCLTLPVRAATAED